jgi:glycosyltransferase involved in cell wall biosynthesis
MTRPLRVCWFGTWREDYSRNRIMIEGLRRNGVEVVECHAALWGGIEDRVKLARGGWAGPRFLVRAVGALLGLTVRFFRTGRWDALILGYPGQFDAYLARPLAWLRHKPLVLDAFMSPWLIAYERGLTRKAPRTAWFLHALERGGLALPDLIIQDTAEYAAWLRREFGVPPQRVRLVPTGADSTRFFPRPAPSPDGLFHVLYAGTFIPNHGVPDMIRAAILLKEEPGIRFTFIGDGPDKAEAEALVLENRLKTVAFEGWVSPDHLPARLAAADLSLGAFGVTPQSLMTVQNKIYEALAMARPVVTGDGPAVRAALTHGEHLWLCPRRNPAALADAIRHLKGDPALRARLGSQGLARFLQIGTVEAVGATLRRHLEELLDHRSKRA